MSDGRGRFKVLGIPSDDYVIGQADRFLMRLIRADRDAYWFSQLLTVKREDKDLAVQLRPALRVEGAASNSGAAARDPSSSRRLPA